MGFIEGGSYIVSWNLTKRCNLLCPHCRSDPDTETSGELTRDEARFVIDELSYLNSRIMLVLGGGEPMLRDDIFDIVEYASQADFITVLDSNGTLLTKEKLKLLKEAGLKGVDISIHSTVPSHHDAFSGLNGAWELSLSALGCAREEGLQSQLNVTMTDRNCREIAGFIEVGAELDASAVNFFFLACRRRTIMSEISAENYEKALKEIAERASTEKRLMVGAKCAPQISYILNEEGFLIPEDTRGCQAGRLYLRIDPEGNVTPCPYMTVELGNVKECSLMDIWENSRVVKLLQEGKYRGRCGICEYMEVCGGCRARAFMEGLDYMGEDPLCRYEPGGKGKPVFK